MRSIIHVYCFETFVTVNNWLQGATPFWTY